MSKKMAKDSLAVLIKELNREHGEGSVIQLGSGYSGEFETVSTGSLTLDRATGINGVPLGRIIEIFGPEAAGKSTILLSIIGQVHKAGGEALLIDTEHVLNIDYAKKIGVNVDRLAICQPDSAEEALDVAYSAINSGQLSVVGIDSVAALVPKAELEGSTGEMQIAHQARLMSSFLRKIAAVADEKRTLVVFTNQLRAKIGVMFGNPNTTSGGRALKFYASMRFDVRAIGAIKNDNVKIGHQIRILVAKNKCSVPYKVAELDLMYESGINRDKELIDLAIEDGLIKKEGSWFKDKKDKAHGEAGMISLLDKDGLRSELEKEILNGKKDATNQ